MRGRHRAKRSEAPQTKRQQKLERVSDREHDAREVSSLGSNGILVNSQGLYKVGARDPLWTYIGKVLRRWPFIWADARSKAFQGGKGTYLGAAWLLIDPILQVGLYALVFGLILRTDRGMDNFIGFLILGVVFFKFSSQGITQGAGLIKRSRPLISSFSFPRACLAASVVIRLFLDNLPALLVGILLAKLFEPELSVHVSLLMLLPLTGVILALNAGFVLITARSTAFVPDLVPLFSTLVRGLFFLSGVFFTIDRFDTHPLVREIVLANPLYRIIELSREIVLNEGFGASDDWLYVTAVALIFLTVGIVYFWQAESRYSSVL